MSSLIRENFSFISYVHFSFHVRNALLGKWSKALIYCENTERYLTRLTSVSVLGLSTHSLAIAYGLLGMHDRAHALFTSLMHTEGKSSAFSIFRELNPFYNELYAKRSELAIAGKERELEVSLNAMQHLDETDNEKQKQRKREREREKEVEGQSKQQSVSEGCVDRTEHVHMLDSTSEVSHNITAAPHTVAIEDRAFDESVDSSLGIIRSLHIEVNEKKHIRTPSFSSVVEAIIKKIRANKLIAKVMKEKRAVKRNSVTATATETETEEVNGLGDNGVCEGAPSAASIPKTPEAQGTISFQLSLMTGRGMDSVKAELCMLNALIAMNGGDVSSNLNTTSKVLSIEEHCEDGLRCIANIFEDSNHNQISYYANTCDQVHSYIVEARLYTILATLCPASPAQPSSSSPQNADIYRSNDLNDLQTATAHTSSHTSPSSSSPKMKHDREYYIQKAKAAMKKCEALGRTLDAPGVLFTTGFQMAVMGIDVERGKSILSESIDIIECEADKIALEKEKEIEKEERGKEIESEEERGKEIKRDEECEEDSVTEGEKLEKTLDDEKQSKEQNRFMYNRKESYDCFLEEEENVEKEEEEEEEGEVTIGIRNVFAILTETETETVKVKETAQHSKNRPPKTVTEIPNYTKKETKPSNKKIDDFKYLKKNSTSFEMSLIPIVCDARRLLEDYKK